MAKRDDNDIVEVRIFGVSITMANELNNIASHLRVSRSDLLKVELRKIKDSYPDYMKETKKKNDY